METPEQSLQILGEFYVHQGDFQEARKIFERLQRENPESFLYHYFLGKIDIELKEIDPGIQNLEKSRQQNPFHKPTLLLLYKTYMEKQNKDAALECLIDAYLLSKDAKDPHLGEYKKQIRTLASSFLPTLDDKAKTALIKNRQKLLNQQIHALQGSSGIPVPEPTADPKEQPKSLPASSGSPQEDLKRHPLFRSLSVSEIEKVIKLSSVRHYAKNEFIYQDGDPIYGFHCILDGKTGISYHESILQELGSGSIPDEAELAGGTNYMFSLRALEDSRLLWINKSAIVTILKRQQDLSLHFLWHFFKSLGLKINSVCEYIESSPKSHDFDWIVKEVSPQRKTDIFMLDSLKERFISVENMKNDVLFSINQPIETFFVLLQGEIELYHPKTKKIVLIKPGEFFSELALISNSFTHCMTGTVRSETATLLIIDREQFYSKKESTRDQYRFMEMLWKIYSRKYLELLYLYSLGQRRDLVDSRGDAQAAN